MTYEVYTLKYRPKNFDDLVGQKAVAETLKRAVQQDRVANAYLFCGSRGVGKTSMARILAKALNCPNAVGGEPCNHCEICESIGRGEDLDVVEIDGASNRGIDDIRSIRDSAGYVPTRARRKIYIIDEVHMLTIQAFNALLKVLEEPPGHVLFVFATTDPNSLPDTILSRCQRHEFRRISIEDIVGRLREICDKEGIAAGDEVLKAIAVKAEGGLRDSISILDQVVSFAGNEIDEQDLEGALGLLPRERLQGLVRSLAAGDASAVLERLAEADQAGIDPQELLQQLTETMRGMMLRLADPRGAPGGLQDEALDDVASEMGLDRVMYVLKLFLNTRGDIRRGGHERIQVELACLKAARSTALLGLDDVLARLDSGATVPAAVPVRSSSPPRPAARPAQSPSPPEQAETKPIVETNASEPVVEKESQPAPADPAPRSVSLASGNEASLRDLWASVCRAMKTKSALLASSLAKLQPVEVNEKRLVASLPPGQAFLGRQLREPDAQRAIRDVLEQLVGRPVAFDLRESSAKSPAKSAPKVRPEDDPVVRKFVEHFDGGVLEVENGEGDLP